MFGTVITSSPSEFGHPLFWQLILEGNSSFKLSLVIFFGNMNVWKFYALLMQTLIDLNWLPLEKKNYFQKAQVY